MVTLSSTFIFIRHSSAMLVVLPEGLKGIQVWLYLFIVTFVPGVELRGSIPMAILYYSLPAFSSSLLITIANIMITPLVFLFWDLFVRIAKHIKFLDRFINFYLANLQKRSQHTIDKYGFWGLLVFVAIPLPGTGAYSGAMIAEIFGMHKMKAFIAVSLGVIIASIIVTLAVMGIIPLTIK